ncbi:Hypp3422 [Branchiostoma lanceolatum]|uniref:Hypp3422 protein n=1 Tax=Branchiostoma lanceolatum TaxID=7740 RepID=A0A8K0A1Y1_BRALA|nr:Hypp3422 [Branchiostoma lanceolatum]
MNKSNMRGENDFGYWAYLQSAKPTMGGMAAEGQLMFKLNNTAAWLEALATEDPAKYKAVMLQARRDRAKWHQTYEDRKKELREKEETKMRQKAEEHAANLRKKQLQMETQRKMLQKHGGPVSCESSCRDFIEQLSVSPLSDRKQKDILRTHIMYIKATNPEMAKSNKLFVLSSKGDPHPFTQLAANLQAIVTSPAFTPDTNTGQTSEHTVGSSASSFSKEDAEDEISRMKAQFLSKAINDTVHERETESEAEKRNDKESEGQNEESNGDGVEREEE